MTFCRETTMMFSNPAEDWEHAMPIGNGKLGAMVFGGIRKERIQVNEDSLWSGGPADRINYQGPTVYKKIVQLFNEGNYVGAAKELNKFSPAQNNLRQYESMGDVWIEHLNRDAEIKASFDDTVESRFEEVEPKVNNYARMLNLEKGLGSIHYQLNNNDYSSEYFASHDPNVVSYELTSEKKDLDCFIYLTRQVMKPISVSGYVKNIFTEEDCIFLTGTNDGGESSLHFCLAAKVVTDGDLSLYGGKIFVEHASRIKLLITAATSYRTDNVVEYCRQTFEEAVQKEEALLKNHTSQFSSLFNNFVLSLSEEASDVDTSKRLEEFKSSKKDNGLIELYFNFSRYLALSSGIDGLPINLQGIWNQDIDPPWGSRFTININLEMNYWPAEKSNLSAVHMSLLKHLKVIHQRGKQVAEKYYGLPGAVTHHSTDIWGDSSPEDNSALSAYWPFGGAWLATNIMEHYRYSRDNDFLKEYFPILKDYCLFLLEYMIRLNENEYVTGPSISPENSFYKDEKILSYSIGNAIDMQISKVLINDYIEANDYLSIQDTYLSKAKEIYPKLNFRKISDDYTLREWIEDFEEVRPGHRHMSHLYALFPSSLFKPWKDKEIADICTRTLKKRLDNGGGHTGWSKAWIINFWARLMNEHEAYKNLCELLIDSTNECLLDIHPPFQIDGNFGGANGILEMIVIDDEKEIVLFPALNETFKRGEMAHMQLKAGGEMDLKWNENDFELKIFPRRDAKVAIYYKDYCKEVHLSEKSIYRLTKVDFENR